MAEYFIRNLPTSVTDEELVALFSTIAPVARAKVTVDNAGVSRGFGSVTFFEDNPPVLQQYTIQGQVVDLVRGRTPANDKPDATAPPAAAAPSQNNGQNQPAQSAIPTSGYPMGPPGSGLPPAHPSITQPPPHAPPHMTAVPFGPPLSYVGGPQPPTAAVPPPHPQGPPHYQMYGMPQHPAQMAPPQMPPHAMPPQTAAPVPQQQPSVPPPAAPQQLAHAPQQQQQQHGGFQQAPRNQPPPPYDMAKQHLASPSVAPTKPVIVPPAPKPPVKTPMALVPVAMLSAELRASREIAIAELEPSQVEALTTAYKFAKPSEPQPAAAAAPSSGFRPRTGPATTPPTPQAAEAPKAPGPGVVMPGGVKVFPPPNQPPRFFTASSSAHGAPRGFTHVTNSEVNQLLRRGGTRRNRSSSRSSTSSRRRTRSRSRRRR